MTSVQHGPDLVDAPFRISSNFGFREMEHAPTVSGKVCVFASVLGLNFGKAVPVGAITFNSKSIIEDCEVSHETSEWKLGSGRNSGVLKTDLDCSFNRTFTFANPDSATLARAGLAQVRVLAKSGLEFSFANAAVANRRRSTQFQIGARFRAYFSALLSRGVIQERPSACFADQCRKLCALAWPKRDRPVMSRFAFRGAQYARVIAAPRLERLAAVFAGTWIGRRLSHFDCVRNVLTSSRTKTHLLFQSIRFNRKWVAARIAAKCDDLSLTVLATSGASHG